MGGFKIIQCPICGRIHNEEVSNSFICESCNNRIYIDSNIYNKYSIIIEQIQNYIQNYDFKNADNAYANILNAKLENDDFKALLLWGRLLCQYEITYVTSYTTNHTVPTFANYSDKLPKITENKYYKDILNLNIDENDKKEYKEKAQKLEKDYEQVGLDLEMTPEYDFFICTKISAACNEEPNASGDASERRIAERLYKDLTSHDFKVFLCSEV